MRKKNRETLYEHTYAHTYLLISGEKVKGIRTH